MAKSQLTLPFQSQGGWCLCCRIKRSSRNFSLFFSYIKVVAHTSAHTSLGAHTIADMNAHMILRAQTTPHMSAHASLGAHTSAHTSLVAHMSACMCTFLRREPILLIPSISSKNFCQIPSIFLACFQHISGIFLAFPRHITVISLLYS